MAGNTIHKQMYRKKVSFSLITGAKIAKGERRDKRKTKFFKFDYAEPPPIFAVTKIQEQKKECIFLIGKHIPLSFIPSGDSVQSVAQMISMPLRKAASFIGIRW